MSNFWQSFTKQARERHYVFVRKIASEGSFYYSWTPAGKIVGRIAVEGQVKEAMLKDPGNFLGKVAEVTCDGRNKKRLVKPTLEQFLSVAKN